MSNAAERSRATRMVAFPESTTLKMSFEILRMQSLSSDGAGRQTAVDSTNRTHEELAMQGIAVQEACRWS